MMHDETGDSDLSVSCIWSAVKPALLQLTVDAVAERGCV